jgi:hypothetical protein
MTNAGNKVGEAFVDLKVNTETLSPGLEEGKVKVEQAVDEIENKVVTGNKNIAQSIQGSISKFTAFIGSITAAIGVATLFFNVGNKIGEALFKVNAQLDEFKQKTAELFTKPIERATLLQDEIVRLESELQKLRETSSTALTAFSTGDVQSDVRIRNEERIQARILELQKELQSAIIQGQRATRLEEDKLIEESAERQRKIAIDLAEGEIKLILEKGEALRKIEADIAAAQSDRIKAALEQERQAINEAFNLRLFRLQQEEDAKIRALEEQQRKEDEARREQERKAIESAERQAKALEKALTSALQSANNQTDALNGRLTVAVEAIESTVRNINANTIRSRN